MHVDAAPEFLPGALEALRDAGVELRADGRTRALAGEALGGSLVAATDADWDTEFLALTLAVGIVDSVAEAIEHVNAHGSGHSEAIVTPSAAAARAFELGVDAACVYVNASTRFTDGAEFGMGAEIGNSTQKLHARGPIGLRELCTFKYVVTGDGHVRASGPRRHPGRDVQPAPHRASRDGPGGARAARARPRRAHARRRPAPQGGRRRPRFRRPPGARAARRGGRGAASR